MTIASITTDINVGPFRIPSNAQNMIMNNYASRMNVSIEVVVPEPILSDKFATSMWLHKELTFSQIFLCSIHQLPRNSADLDQFIESFQKIKFFFAIEGLIGTGEKFLKKCVDERSIFDNAEVLNEARLGWLNLYQLSKSN